MSSTAEQVKQAADQARAAALAYEAAFAATVPPPVIAENRALLMSLVATNILGQNTPAIAATETHYAEMWAQDATTMYGYAGRSAAASVLTQFTAPPQNTDSAGVGAQAAAVNHAVGTSATARTSTILSNLISAVPTALQGLSGDPVATGADFLNFTSGFTFVTSGVLFILGPLLVGPIEGALPATSLGWSGPALGAAGAAGLMGSGAPGASALVSAEMPAGLGRSEVLAGLGRAASIGGLSVPPTWSTAAPAIGRAAALPEPALLGLSEPEADGLGPGLGGMLPGSLMAAAAGGGGAAGGGWAATRGGGSAQRDSKTAQPAGTAQPDGGTPARYGPPPTVIPQVAREAGLHQGRPSQASQDPRAQAGESLLGANIRDEINDLRRQIAELAMERDVLMRSLALWAREPTER